MKHADYDKRWNVKQHHIHKQNMHRYYNIFSNHADYDKIVS